MKIKEREIDSIKPYEFNNRRHPKEQVKRIAKSIEDFGFDQPIIVDAEDVIIAGHGRWLAAKELGLTKVPCVESTLEEVEARARRILDNKLQNDSEWDFNNLELELGWLEDNEFDLEPWGLGDLLPEDEPEVEEDDFQGDASEERPLLIKQGDLIELGRHRVLCGDSTQEKSYSELLRGQKVDLVFTSPPYNADTKMRDGGIFNNKKAKDMYVGDNFIDKLNSTDYINFTRKVLSLSFNNTDGFIFWNVSYNNNSKFEYISQITDKLEYLIEQICWKKSSAIPIKGMLMRDWEPIYVFSTAKNNLGLDNVVSNFWDVSNRNVQTGDHKACFPVGLPAKAIKISRGFKSIFDPFLGSGTTLIAADQLNRTCYGIELEPKYCQVIVDRFISYRESINGTIEMKINGEKITIEEWRAATSNEEIEGENESQEQSEVENEIEGESEARAEAL